MLNFQIRGTKVESTASLLGENQFNSMYDFSASSKISIPAMLLGKNPFGYWRDFKDLFSYEASLNNKENEIHITYYDDNDYYSDGYTFCRAKIIDIDISRTTPFQKNIKLFSYVMINTGFYYGNCFEADLEGIEMKFFDIKQLRAEKKNAFWINQNTISKLKYNGIELNNQAKSKNELQCLNTIILKVKNRDKENQIFSKSSFDSMEIIYNSTEDLKPGL